ncbi:MAG: hypothetical protein PHP37_03400 [Patescibacteria group bacterium]|nr:hypothetical protein [Patescibacteria group bacterium]
MFFKKTKEIPFKKMLIMSIFLNIFLWLIWPVASSDIFGYIYQGRVWAVFKENPYLTSYINFQHDLFFNSLENMWSGYTSRYGPIFTIINGGFTFFFKNNIIFNLFGLKFFLILINILNGYLIYNISKNKESFYLYAFNPLILFEFSINGHNDVVFVFFIILSAFFLNKKKLILKNYLFSFFFLVLSILTKFISVILLPVFALSFLIKINKKILSIFYLFLIFCATLLISYRPFSKNILDIAGAPLPQLSMLSPLSSPLIILLLSIFNLTKKILSEGSTILIARIIFIACYLIILFDIIKKKDVLKKENKNNSFFWYFGLTLLLFYLTAIPWLMPWYFPALLVFFIIIFAKISKKRYFSLLTIFGITFYGIINYLFLR